MCFLSCLPFTCIDGVVETIRAWGILGVAVVALKWMLGKSSLEKVLIMGFSCGVGRQRYAQHTRWEVEHRLCWTSGVRWGAWDIGCALKGGSPLKLGCEGCRMLDLGMGSGESRHGVCQSWVKAWPYLPPRKVTGINVERWTAKEGQTDSLVLGRRSLCLCLP